MTILDTISRLFSIYIRIAPDLIRYTNFNNKEFIYSNQIGSFLTILDTISRLSSIYINCTRFNITIYYSILSTNFIFDHFVITYECKLIHKEFIYCNQIGSFLTILDTISRLSSIYIHIAPDLIRYTLITIYYPSCQQISVCYNLRVQAYSQRIYIQQSNWVIFDHFGHYFRLSSIYIHIAPDLIRYTLILYIIHIILSIKFQFVINYECKLIHKEFIYSNQIGSFLTILDTISRLSSIYIHIAPDLIRYTLITIYYPSCQQISVCYNLQVQAYSQRIYI